MVHIPAADGGETSDTISVDTAALKTTAPTFRQVGQQVSTVQQSIENSVQMGTGEMFLVMEFAKLASLLEQVQSRITTAMQCAAGGLNRIGTTLEIASQLYEENEDILGRSFTQLEDDKSPWNIHLHLLPGIITIKPGGSFPHLPPQLNPAKKPQQPSVNPQPGIIPGLEPDIP